jgi:hypothetical protein
MRMRNAILAAVLVGAATQPVLADERRDALQSSYALWGMMEGAATFCATLLKGDFSIAGTHIDWVSRNMQVMDELEAAREQAGEPSYLTSEWLAAGRDGITSLLQQATNAEEACANWKSGTETGGYEAETFLAQQLGILRERDGL